MSSYIFEKLGEIAEKYDSVQEVRGMGLLIGVKMKEGLKSAVIEKALEKKLLLAGAGHEVVRFLPPLNVTREEIDEAVSRFASAVSEL